MEYKIRELIDLINSRKEVEKINSVIVDDIKCIIKIYFTITKEYAQKYNLDYLNRVFEYNPEIQNLSHTREYAYIKGDD